MDWRSGSQGKILGNRRWRHAIGKATPAWRHRAIAHVRNRGGPRQQFIDSAKPCSGSTNCAGLTRDDGVEGEVGGTVTLYLWKVRNVTSIAQIAFTTASFPVWALNISATRSDFINPTLVGVVLILITVAIPLVPTKDS